MRITAKQKKINTDAPQLHNFPAEIQSTGFSKTAFMNLFHHPKHFAT